MLQAFIDDSESNTGERRLVLAAYVAPAQEWAEFSDAWEAALHREPRIEYFKMAEAQNRRDQFEGWSESKRTAKLVDLARVISAFSPLSVDCSMSTAHQKKVLKPYAPYGLATPYYPLVFALTCGVARICHSLGVHLPCDFIFDRQDNVSKQVLLFWDHTISQQPPEWARLINPSPIFRDDKDFVALQAADMLAWHTRRDLEGTYPAQYEQLRDLIRIPGLSYSVEIPNDVLEYLGEGMKSIPGTSDIRTKREWNAVVQQILTDAGVPRS
ncbi:DUF3800 domain-containing protein [Sphingomonas sp. F9_3S_D5_B_2]